MTSIRDYEIFTPITIAKDLVLKNRIVLAPLTRARADIDTHTPNAHNVEYYAQRASAGLIVGEASAVSAEGFGWYGAPALYNHDHVEGWKKVTDAVHAKGGKMFFQLWHMGRQGHSSFNDKHEIVSSSAIQLMEGHLRNSKGEHVPFEMPRALETHEIAGVVESYRRSAELAKQAGFDGVDIHAGNGYLVDQFLQSSTNTRTDQYGGSFENRSRFLLEIIAALQTVWPSDRIGLRLSPNGVYGGMGSADNYEQFMYTMGKLSELNLAYLVLLDAHASWGAHDKGRLVKLVDAKMAFKGRVMANVAYTRDTGEGALRTGAADLISIGRTYMSNPDLVERYQNDWPLNEEAPREFWWDANKGAEGYTTYKPYSSKA